MNQATETGKKMAMLMGELFALINTPEGAAYLETEAGEHQAREVQYALQAADWDKATADHAGAFGPENETRRAA